MTSVISRVTGECAMPEECAHKRSNVLLRENVKELQHQLQESYKRVAELSHTVDRLRIEISSNYHSD